MTTGSEATFLFADIAGFTALTEAHGDEQAVQLVDDFAAVVPSGAPESCRRVRQVRRRRAHAPSARSCRRDSPRTVDHAECDERSPGTFGSSRRPLRLRCRTQRRLLWHDHQRRRPRFSARPRWGTPRHRQHSGARTRHRQPCSTNRAGGKPCATSRSPWRSSQSFAWTRTLIISWWIPFARWRSIRNEPSVACCSKGARITSVRLVAWPRSHRTDTTTPSRGQQRVLVPDR